jgi:hypothetical protein
MEQLVIEISKAILFTTAQKYETPRDTPEMISRLLINSQ